MKLDFDRDEAKAGIDRAREEEDARIKFQRQERDDAQKHAEKMVETREKSFKREQELLQNLDFKALFELAQTSKDETSEANEEFARQRQARLQSLQDELDDIQRKDLREREDRLTRFNEQLTDRSIAYHQERAQIQQQTQEKLLAAQQSYQAEMQQIHSKYAQELSIRQQAMQSELQLLMQTEAQRKQILMQTQQDLLAQARALAQQMGITNMPQSVRSAVTQEQVRTTFSNAASQVQQTVSNIANSPLVNMFRNAFGGGRAFGGGVSAGNYYRVNEPYSSQMERFVTSGRSYALPGGEGLFMPLKSGQIDPNRGGGGNSINVTIQVNGVEMGGLTPEEVGEIAGARLLDILQPALGG